MGKLSFGRVLDRFCLSSSGSGSCLCINNYASEDERELESKPLITPPETGQLVKIKDVISAPPTLALQLKPKTVVLKVSMHCNGCARKVKKHISKMEGVTSYEVDLESKMVVVIGDIAPFEVLESVSKVKTAELWTAPAC
ncbi:heavy metal-associated isoprenylated plant protein 35-like isoform X2 [Coffea arabica]|uniref:Heavy metal-associated isoprenylated plant protein 35-like isoform X2 n=1 Tax=Coffea arabica TaxID=13443 RepID=A0A6P6STQ1_COFAR|nr:heavy metal-associated isoprenylated plant protein 35-like isoform X2 [Coffea arabica]